MPRVHLRLIAATLPLMLLLAIAAGSTAKAQSLVLYSGRDKVLSQPLIDRFERQTNIEVKVKHGKGAQLLATLRQEGKYSPADMLWAETAGVLGAAVKAGYFTKLPEPITNQPDAFHSSSGRWVPITARFRVLAYNPRKVDPSELPDSVLDLPRLEQFKGRIGWTPGYSSFQDFVTALRLTQGRPTAKQWLARMKQMNPKSYSSNLPMIRAMANGRLDIALTNHYYVHQLKRGGPELRESEEGEHEEAETQAPEPAQPLPKAPVKIHHFQPGDPGNLALVTGAGILKTSDNKEAARQFIRFLLSKKSQRFAAETVTEYPVIGDVKLPDHLLSMEKVLKLSPRFDFERLSELGPTLKLMREQGLF